MLIHKIRNMRCWCVSGECCLVNFCFVNCKIGKIYFFHGDNFFNHSVSVYNSTLKKQKSKFLSLKTVSFYSYCVSFYTPLERYTKSHCCAVLMFQRKRKKKNEYMF